MGICTPFIGKCVPLPCKWLETHFKWVVGPSFHMCAPPYPLTCHLGMCHHTPNTLLPHPHVFSLELTLSLFVKWKHQALNWKLLWWKAWVISSTNAPSFDGQLIPEFTSFTISPQPKSSRPHWLKFSMSCLFPWIFDKCWKSKRGILSLSCYLRDLSLPHYSPFFTVLLCYQILHLSFFLSIIVILLHWFCSWRAWSNFVATTSSHWIIKNCFGGIESVGFCLHAPYMYEVILLFTSNVIVLLSSIAKVKLCLLG